MSFEKGNKPWNAGLHINRMPKYKGYCRTLQQRAIVREKAKKECGNEREPQPQRRVGFFARLFGG